MTPARSSMQVAPRVGAFSIDLSPSDGARWVWSDLMFVIHGFAPGEVRPTLELWLAHAVDEDRAAVRRALERSDRAAAFVYRLRDAQARERHCVLVVLPSPEGAEGYLVDMTEEWRRASADRANEAVQATSGQLAPVEQAIGIIVAQRDVDAAAAVRMLQDWAARRDEDVSTAAREVVDAAVRGEDALAPDRQMSAGSAAP